MATGLFNLKQVNQAISQGAWSGYIAPKWVEYLVVAGGGSGAGNRGLGGGGGAGGLLSGIVTVTAGTSYSVTVGGGGVDSSSPNGGVGGNSAFGTISASGGGTGGEASASVSGFSGGSGGGGGNSTVGRPGGNGVVGQGNSGGTGYSGGSPYGGGGGGGAGTVGLNATSAGGGGNGGAGIASVISGTVVAYAGGGGGGAFGTVQGTGGVGGGGAGSSGSAAPTAGTVNTGGGGGSDGRQIQGGNGGSGIVVVRYPGNVQFYTGGAITYVNGYIVHIFYANGTLAPTTPAVVASDYQISRSLRFNSADSAYLSRTLTTPTNNIVWSFSFWLKRSKLITQQYLLNVNSYCGIGISNDIIYFWNNAGALAASTTAVFRDVSAWYHLVFVSNGTTIKGYVNNSEVMSYTGTITNLNSAVVHNIGRDQTSSDLYLDGYMTEVNFVDGQALTPSSFGATNTNTGVWGPKAYTGTYGTNGFKLNFSDNSNTTAATLGADSSGNGNNWTPNNFSVTAGVGNDSLVDVPTPYGSDYGVGGEVRGNYCTINPLGTNTGTQPTISNGNLQMTVGVAQLIRLGTISVASGKWYWEVVYTTATNFDGMVGVQTPDTTLNSFVGNAAKSFGYYYNGTTYNSGSAYAYGNTWTTGDVIGVALDMDNGAIYFSKNGTFQNSGVPTSGASKTGAAFTTLSGLTIAPAYNGYGGTQVINHGQRPFAYTAPSGFKALCTTNLPAPTIGSSPTTLATQFFNAVTYTGAGGSQSITGVGFQPDFVWMKSRNTGGTSHILQNAVTGVTKGMSSNATDSEFTDATTLTAFNSDGFTVGGNSQTNGSGTTYVAWNWKANGSGSSNTAGTITSTVSANTTSGFSIVTYTGNGTAGATRGHGLGVAPNMILIKGRTNVDSWHVYHSSLGNTQGLLLESTTAAIVSPYFWNDTSPSSTVFTTNLGTSNNANGVNYVAYCFAEVAGYSKFGSWTGNGSTDGPFVFTGFRPAFILYKRSSDAGNLWRMTDSTRSTYNLNDTAFLYPDSTSSENQFVNDGLDILSNGFKLKVANDPSNATGSTYIFMAFASTPFKYSLAR